MSRVLVLNIYSEEFEMDFDLVWVFVFMRKVCRRNDCVDCVNKRKTNEKLIET